MANPNLVVGARPHTRVTQANTYIAQSEIVTGDLVKKNAAGTVERAAAGDALLGVALTNALAAGEVLVCDDPDQQYSIQADDASIDDQTDIGLNYNFIVGTYSTVYKRSAMQLDASTGATTQTLPLRLVAIDRTAGNALGAQVKCVVKINQHQNSTNVVGV